MSNIKEQILQALGLETSEKVQLEYQDKLEDGTIIVSSADELAAGVDISILAEDGTTIPLPVGEYKTEGGVGFSVEEEGVVAEIYEEEAPEEEEEEAPVEAERKPKRVKETKEVDFKEEVTLAELSDVFKAILSEINEKVSNLTDAVAELKSENEDMTSQVEELSKQPAGEPLNTNKFSSKNRKKTQVTLSKSDYSNLTRGEKYWYNLNN